MLDLTERDYPSVVKGLAAATQAVGFTLASDMLTGSLLRTLAASKPSSMLLEIGTGTGMGTSWILDGMDTTSRLVTVDQNEKVVAIARQHLGHDPRVTFQVVDGAKFIASLQGQGGLFDFIFADSYPGKFDLLDETLALLKTGGLYIIDDLLPQTGWVEDHQEKVDALVTLLEQRRDLRLCKLNWSTGIIVAVRQSIL